MRSKDPSMVSLYILSSNPFPVNLCPTLMWWSQTDTFLPSTETKQALDFIHFRSNIFTDGTKTMIQLLLRIPTSLAKIFHCGCD